MSLNIEISKDGYKILRINKDDKKIYLGSKYNQKREVEKFINSIKEITSKDNFIIFGLSFGEHIEALLKIIDEKSKILIIEFNEELLEYCKNDKDSKKIFDNDKITVTFDKEEIEKFILENISEINADKLKNLEYCNYTRIYKEEYQETFKLIRDWLMRIKINRNTMSNFGEEFLRNTISNLKYIAKSTNINKLKNAYADKPAIIVSAGPSLIKNVDELKGVNNAVILSGGRTLETLLERNINVTCFGVVDPGEYSYKVVENCIGKVKTPLLYNDMSNEKVVREHKGKKFFYTSSNFISQAFQQDILSLYGGGSIAHTLTNLAIHMGCNPIIFIGQDLAYTGEINHADCCKNSWEKSNAHEDKDGNDIYVKDVNGDIVRTSILLNDFRVSLEKIINEYTHIRFINATEGGAFIEGTENRKLKDVLAELKKEEILPILNFLDNGNKSKEILEQLEITLIEIEEYIKLCKNAKRLLKDYEIGYRLKNQNKLDISIEKLNKIDKKIIEKNHKIDIITTVIQKIIYEIENDDQFITKNSDSKNIRFNKELNRSSALYSRLEASLEFYYEKFIEGAKKIKGEIQ